MVFTEKLIKQADIEADKNKLVDDMITQLFDPGIFTNEMLKCTWPSTTNNTISFPTFITDTRPGYTQDFGPIHISAYRDQIAKVIHTTLTCAECGWEELSYKESYFNDDYYAFVYQLVNRHTASDIHKMRF